ncbi:MAG: TonB-dependent receptor [Bacteroidetes bacterium]|nr:TonB-dependent receptor [Bacteroidota bacterium]
MLKQVSFKAVICFGLISFLFLSFAEVKSQTAQRHTISGYVYEKGSKETLIGVNVYISKIRSGTTTNNYGFYSITLPSDSIEIVFSYVGYQSIAEKVFLNRNIVLDIELEPVISLSEVVVESDKVDRISNTAQMSRIEVPIQNVKAIPSLLGEKDVFKIIQLLPGVKQGGEGSSGYYVRGGGPDQNLIILDDAIVYNASHLFGFFSVFNGDAIKNVQLYKGGFPARFGGRLSSVLDISMKDGNKQKYSGEAGIGIIASRLLLEGPIIKDKASFLISGRRTYLDVLMKPFMSSEASVGYFFYDLNAKLNYDIDRKNKLFLSGYFGRDKFFTDMKSGSNEFGAGLYWQNATTTLRWNRLITDRFFANQSFIFSDYTLKIYMDQTFEGYKYQLSYSSGIQDFGAKTDMSWHPNPSNLVRFGLQSTYHRFTPSAFVMRDDYFNEFTSEVKNIDVVESGLYVEDEIKIGDRIVVHPGFRLSHFVHEDKHYFGPEPRFSTVVKIMDDLAWKGSYALMNQYVHLLSPTGIGLPTDLWVPSTKNIAPQQTWQIATGFAKDFLGQNIEVSIEGYYKKSDNTIGYKEGASFMLIDDPSNAEEVSWEDNITSGQAWSYGGELFIQKKAGKFSGWIGYTLSWTQLQFDDVNNGQKFWARYDSRHDISLVGIYEFLPNIQISATWVYSTGNAITLPTGEYALVTHNPLGTSAPYYHDNFFDQNGTPFQFSGYNWISDYGDKNSFRAAPYHRMDLGVQFKKKRYIKQRLIERTFEIGVYNLYNRKNPYFYYMGYDDSNQRVLRQVSVFPILPSLSVNYKF